MTPSVVDLLTISEAAGLLQPHLGRLTAVYWLTDMRRSKPVYRIRVFSPPKYVKFDGSIKYPRTEVERVIRELALFDRLSASLAHGGFALGLTAPMVRT